MQEELLSRNALLASVEPSAWHRVEQGTHICDLELGQVLYSLGNHVTHVWFPLEGLIGIVSETPDGETIDSALLGREGAVGVFEACGSRQFFAEAVVQVPGRAARMSASAYRGLFEASPGLRDAVHRYVEQLISETRQFVACNSTHEVEARLCRVVLDALDRSGLSSTLPLTQRAIARMLGAQRSTVAEVLARLAGEGLVSTRRGALIVEDRQAMEALCCGCRVAVRMARDAIWSTREPSCDAAIAAE